MAQVPAWLEDERAMDMAGESSGVGGSDDQSPNLLGAKLEVTDTNRWRLGFRVTAMCLSVLMVVSSILELANLSSFTRFFIAMYNILFATVLLFHESQGFIACERVDFSLRRNFGLLYGHMGRAVFIIFIAFLNFALTDAGWWGTCTGSLLLLLGAVMLLIYLKHPHLLDEAPGPGDLDTAPRRDGYAPPPTMPSTNL